VFGKIGELMRAEAPALFGDYTVTEDGTWSPAGARSRVGRCPT
jgi:thymidylate synthase (FAD)